MKKHDENEEPIELNTENEEEVVLDGDVEVPVTFPEDDAEAEDAAAGDLEEAEASEETEENKTAAELAELKDRYMRLLAEYDNFRRRTQKEKDNLYADAVASVTKEFLTLIDNLDRATEGAKKADETSLDKVIQGMELVGRQAQDTLSKIGVEDIPAERGTKFDPNLHDAMMHVDDEELGEQEIAMVFAKGYKYKDRVIRHAQVQVAN